ncbi:MULTISPECIES: hypothetical protein [unclassified Thioalkalivibrio]|uniref:hypothetical protein n=1 Tax=unclassified Thioalkalivibrio TaxID=2621013 RepID=UPI000379D20B|nr:MULTISPECIES: hypothetical protein [unclassified Thioalkalivibrio]
MDRTIDREDFFRWVEKQRLVYASCMVTRGSFRKPLEFVTNVGANDFEIRLGEKVVYEGDSFEEARAAYEREVNA